MSDVIALDRSIRQQMADRLNQIERTPETDPAITCLIDCVSTLAGLRLVSNRWTEGNHFEVMPSGEGE